MKTTTKWNKRVTNIITRIHQEFPELHKYIVENPISSVDNGGINGNNLEEYYNSLAALLEGYSKTHEGINTAIDKPRSSTYPLYPPSEDIYNQETRARGINPRDLSKEKAPNEAVGSWNEKSFREDMSGDDLDVPGSELDDQQESVGSEDEENNYYSLGGDNHNDLEEDNTMKIQSNTDKTVNGDKKSQSFFISQIVKELNLYQSYITRIEVHLSDENGKKGGRKDLRCLLEARLAGRQPLTVSSQADTTELAISGAIGKLKAALETTLGRIQNHHSQPSQNL